MVRFLVLIKGSNKAFLVHDSCRATVRNGTSISADVTNDDIERIRMTIASAIFR